MIELNDTTVELPLHFYHRFYLVFKVEGESVVNHFLSSIKIVYTILLIIMCLSVEMHMRKESRMKSYQMTIFDAVHRRWSNQRFHIIKYKIKSNEVSYIENLQILSSMMLQ